MLEIGTVYRHNFSYTQDDVIAYANISGDKNPLHLDATFAATTQFGRPIIHGMLGVSVFTKVIGTWFPGAGTVYVKQTIEFKRPMFVDTEYVAVFTVISTNPEKHFGDIQCEIFDATTNKLTTTGVATIMHKEQF
jgi:acyl dehydratase